MVVGHDLAVLGDDEARTQTLTRSGGGAILTGQHVLEPAAQFLGHAGGQLLLGHGLLLLAGHFDEDDGRGDGLDQVGIAARRDRKRGRGGQRQHRRRGHRGAQRKGGGAGGFGKGLGHCMLLAVHSVVPGAYLDLRFYSALPCPIQICEIAASGLHGRRIWHNSSAILHEDTMKLLVVEDDTTTSTYIARGLREEGHAVDVVADGRDGLVQATTGQYDVLILDRMLPELDGLTLLKTLRGAGNTTPVLLLTAMGAVEDRIDGLNAGADDYLVKPFAFGELSARVNALARRPQALEQETVLRAGDLTMDLISRRVTRAGQEIDLLPREFALLEHLLRRKGRVQTRTMLLEAVWDISFDPMTNVVETHISRLRAKVDRPFDSELIQTVRGAGYRIDA